ncbi:2TM domain-containing protein [Flavobacterium sp.]|uniref:2TM domain-containing protein n=1 Tax=Flavobacterium sp. TaxID=239 RepID=UPI00286E95F0|nr:2TM domain-containing protein [Flavobacterium sp.]
MEKTKQYQKALEEILRRKVKNRKEYYIHFLIYLVVLAIYVAKHYFKIEFNFPLLEHINTKFVVVWTLIFAGFTISFLINENVFGSHWEQKKIQKIMDSENQEKTTWE